MKLKLLTYNLLYGFALPDAKKLIEEEKPDIICVQELPTDKKKLMYLAKPPYELACWTNSFVKFWSLFGIAVYLNKETCSLIDNQDCSLPESTYDFWVYLSQGLNITRRFSESKILFKPSNKEFYLYNTHLTHLSFAEHRLTQIQRIFEDMEASVDKKTPVLITGDLNLYNGKPELERMMTKFNLKEATSNLAYTFQHRVLFWTWKTKLDYIMYRNLEVVSTKRFDKGSSDHHPVMSEFEL